MVCHHLRELEAALLKSGLPVTFRGQVWSENCREWVCFDGFLNTRRIRQQFVLAACVQDHTHRGTHDGSEHGLVCTEHHDALVGFVEPVTGRAEFPDEKANA